MAIDTMKNNALVLYKNMPAVVTGGPAGGKFSITFRTAPATATRSAAYGTQGVRAKDVALLHEGPVSSLPAVLARAEQGDAAARASGVEEAYELLLSDEETARSPVAFADLASLLGAAQADEAWAVFCAFRDSASFSMSQKDLAEGNVVFVPRTLEERDALVRKADEKGREAELRGAFILRLKQNALELPGDGRYMVDVENLALGKADKSRAMHEARIRETPERAHRLLLDTGVWDITRNPYPLRWGLSMKSASEGLPSPPEEERLRVPGVSYAIDNEWSTDPDDAVAWDGTYVWVHIADPASTVMPDSSIDKSARARGATLYIPEGAARMLCEDALEDYALGLQEESRALSFRLSLAEDGAVTDCAVFKTIVDVRRLTYQRADELRDSPGLAPLFAIAERNVARRVRAGAVQIQLPEVHLTVSPEDKAVRIEPEARPVSADVVRELMLLAGEGAAQFAFRNQIPFPFVSQEAPTIPDDVPDGIAGQFRLRRCMHRRSVGVTPAAHAGLGLGMYSQVTSPLRRYGDLIAHEQLRAFLDGRPLLDKDTMLMRVSEGEAAAQAAHKVERKSNQHWTLVFLLQNPGWTGTAVCVDTGGRQPQFFIPSLGMETFMAPARDVPLNGEVLVRAANINLPELSVDFVQAE